MKKLTSSIFVALLIVLLQIVPASAIISEKWEGNYNFNALSICDTAYFDWNFYALNGPNAYLPLVSDINVPGLKFESAGVDIKIYSDDRWKEKVEFVVNIYDGNIVPNILYSAELDIDDRIGKEPYFTWHYDFTTQEILALNMQGLGRISVDAKGLTDFTLKEVTIGGQPVPEPSTLLLLGAGLIGLAGYGRKKFKK